MVQYVAGGGGAVAHIEVSEGTDEHFVDGGDETFLKGLVGLVVLVEDSDGNIMGVAKVGDMGSRRNRWDGRLGTGVDQSNEVRGQECCIHDGGDGEV